jgi:carboxybiotin decarboxylase
MKRLLTIAVIVAFLSILRLFVFPQEQIQRVNAAAGQDISLTQEEQKIQGQGVWETAAEGLRQFYLYTGFRNATSGHLIMIVVGLFFIFLAIKYDYEPLLLIPIGAGIIMGNIPFFQSDDMNLQLGIYQEGSVMNYLYFGVMRGIYPPLIFLGIGAMTDFSSLISRPRLMLLGAAAQVGIFLTFLGALWLGFTMKEAGAIGIIGGADGPTAIFLSSRLAEHLIGPIAIAAYSYMALVPVIQPPIMRLMTSKRERLIRMSPPRAVSQTEKILFPLIGLIVTAFISPSSLPLLGMLFFRKPAEGVNPNQEARRNSKKFIDRYSNYSAWTYSGCVDSG